MINALSSTWIIQDIIEVKLYTTTAMILLATLIIRYYKKKKDKDIHIKLIASKTVE